LNRIFDADLLYALNRSEEVRERYYEPQLNSRLVDILTKWNNAINSNGAVTYTLTDKEHDFSEVIRLAETYGITNASDFVHQIYAYLKNATLPQPKTVFGINDPNNWVYTIVCGFEPVFIYIVYLVSNFIYRKHSFKRLKTILGIIFGATLIQGVLSSLLQYPLDFQWFGIQPIVIAIMWIVGFFAVEKIRKRARITPIFSVIDKLELLVSLRSPRTNNNKTVPISQPSLNQRAITR